MIFPFRAMSSAATVSRAPPRVRFRAGRRHHRRPSSGRCLGSPPDEDRLPLARNRLMTDAVTPDTVRAWLAGSPFIAFMNLEVVSVDAKAGAVEMKMPMRPEFERGGGIGGQFHGGPIAALIDTVGDFAVAVSVGGGVPTINFRVDYLRPSTGSHLLARART